MKKEGGKWNACSELVEEPEEKRPLGRTRRRQMNNTEMHLREVGWGCMNWIHLAQDRSQ
jgi:hypothetical protein